MRLNPWLKQKLEELEKRKVNPQLDIVVEVEPDRLDEVLAELEKIPDVEIHYERISWRRFIPVTAPDIETVERIARIPGVVMVHYEAPVYIRGVPFILPPKITDVILGEISLSKVEIPGFPVAAPLGLMFAPLAVMMKMKKPEVEIIPTGETRKIIGAPEDNEVTVKVAVLDTGCTLLHPQLTLEQKIETHSVTGEPPADGQGHGQWCVTGAFGGEIPTHFGRCKGVSFARNIISVKCLSNLGFGATSWVLAAMEIAYKRGARIVNMSLGSELQGSIEQDPLCRVIEMTKDKVIWVVAAGNEGPEEWTIGSPGAAPSALTVASYSPMYKDVAIFSSRGPQGAWYKDKPRLFSAHYRKYGEDFLKPDLMAPGGGPVKEDDVPDLIYSGITGWFDGFYDYLPNLFEAMRGTSMAAPHAAGLAALLYERKGIRTARDIKQRMRVLGEKDVARGYGLIHWDLF